MIVMGPMVGGCFDCLHIGHVRHLQEAWLQYGELTVALTIDPYVNKGPGRPVFSWVERAEMLSALHYVKLVLPVTSGVDAIRLFRPSVYIKGAEYQDKNIEEELICKQLGKRIVFLNTPVYSSTKILTGELLRERIATAGQGGK